MSGNSMTTGEQNMPNSVPARLNPNRSEWNFRYVRLSAAMDAILMGYYPHPDVLIGMPYEFDSMWMEWMCKCPQPLKS